MQMWHRPAGGGYRWGPGSCGAGVPGSLANEGAVAGTLAVIRAKTHQG